MVAALAAAVEHGPAAGVRVLEVPDIRSSNLGSKTVTL
jgi:putative N-acetylmannosamine-6-phosphate epimerase